jgi:hypothetical protein
MNRLLMRDILQKALKRLENPAPARAYDLGICGVVHEAYKTLCPKKPVFEMSDGKYFLDRYDTSTRIMMYLRDKYMGCKSIGDFWWPIAEYPEQIGLEEFEKGRRKRIRFLRKAIHDLTNEFKEDL